MGCHHHDIVNFGIESNAEGDGCEDRQELYDNHVENNAVRMTSWSRILLPPPLEDHVEDDNEVRDDQQTGGIESGENIVANIKIQAHEKS